jgi:ornithine--oxo-acid transaminase
MSKRLRVPMVLMLMMVFKAKPTHQNIIRLAPPLVITEEEIRQALRIIDSAMKELPGLKGRKEDEVIPEGEECYDWCGQLVLV